MSNEALRRLLLDAAIKRRVLKNTPIFQKEWHDILVALKFTQIGHYRYFHPSFGMVTLVNRHQPEYVPQVMSRTDGKPHVCYNVEGYKLNCSVLMALWGFYGSDHKPLLAKLSTHELTPELLTRSLSQLGFRTVKSGGFFGYVQGDILVFVCDRILVRHTMDPDSNAFKFYYNGEPVVLPTTKEEKVMGEDSKFIIGSINRANGIWSIASNPNEHTSESHARREAERLAQLDPSKTFVLMEIKGRVRMESVTWTK